MWSSRFILNKSHCNDSYSICFPTSQKRLFLGQIPWNVPRRQDLGFDDRNAKFSAENCRLGERTYNVSSGDHVESGCKLKRDHGWRARPIDAAQGCGENLSIRHNCASLILLRNLNLANVKLGKVDHRITASSLLLRRLRICICM